MALSEHAKRIIQAGAKDYLRGPELQEFLADEECLPLVFNPEYIYSQIMEIEAETPNVREFLNEMKENKNEAIQFLAASLGMV